MSSAPNEPKTLHLTVVVCAAGPASDVAKVVVAAQANGWAVNLIATPAALPFLDIPALEGLSGYAVRSHPRNPDMPRDRTTPPANAILVAPATFNSVNKLAAGIADNYALTVLAELLGAGVPTVVVPFVNLALASRVAYQRSLQVLRAEGVRIIEGAEEQWLPHPAGTGEIQAQKFPWLKALEVLRVMAKP